MRIAQVAPPWFTVPPTGYGGVEMVVSLLADGLVDRGHEVTLFASGGSQSKAKLVTHFAEPQHDVIGNPAVEASHVLTAYRQWPLFDVIHDHTLLGLLAGAQLPVAVVHTVHGPVTPPVYDFYEAVAGQVCFINISRHQQSTMPPRCNGAVIHNASDVSAFPFCPDTGEYLLFVGRMSPEKGILDAIEIAKGCALPLRIAAKINEPAEVDYFERCVQPQLRTIEHEFIGQLSRAAKAALYGDALATLFPIAWDEPFGLVMTESMATGTPVIAFGRGSVPEVIDDGRTGFICSSVAEAVEAVSCIPRLSRWDCRCWVEEQFGLDQHIARHEALYQQARLMARV